MGQKYSVTIDIGADITKVRAAADELSSILSKSNFNLGFSGKIEGMISKLNGALSELEVKSSKAMTSLGDTKSVETSINKVNTIIKNITAELTRMGNTGSDSLLKLMDGMDSKWKSAEKAQKDYTRALRDTNREATTLSRKLEEAQSKGREANRKFTSEDSEINSISAKIETLKREREALKSSSGLSYSKLDDDLKKAEDNLDRINTLMTNLAGGKNKLKLFQAGDTSKFTSEQLESLNKYNKELDETSAKIKNLESQQESLNLKRKEYDELIKNETNKRIGAENRQGAAYRQYTEAESAITEIQKQINDLNSAAKDTSAFENYKQKLNEIFGDESILKAKNVDELNSALENLKKNGIQLASSELQKLLNVANSTGAPLTKMGNDARKAGEGLKDMTDRASEIDTLTYRLKYFFSLAGGFNLMRRAIRSAVTTTKELDAVMTQTAVVSQYTVGDMWKTLPQYSKEAQKLGVAIKDVYSAQTLYVQQGLDMNSAMDIGIETMKMARVANIGAEEATNSMTAALRGFNMELTETSAKRVNDVYSKLAQNTASNTQEISTAMTKTAALANSANMSFENTAAFLATIIESTREGAETAGTALKTVIARFTEVKKLYSQGELLGTDEEGQEVDVNKISKALRTAGINMNDFFTGAKGLDEIFMELGSKWDSLTTVQQRYIATMAAGSRQQSRFLALMQNYSRTVELTQMAYNSAGSGQEQFDKTLESLDAKVNKFKDAWATFVMSISNSDAIKGFVDVGTDILDFLNNIINKISGNNGLVKSILSIATAIGVFKGGRAIFRGILGDIKSTISGTPKTSMAGRLTTFWGGAKSRWGNTREGIRNIPELFGFRNYNNYKQNIKEAATNLEYARYSRDATAKELEKIEKETPEERALRTGEGPSEKQISTRLGKAAIVKTYNAKHSADVEEKKEELKKEEDKVKSAEKENTEATENAVVAMNNYAAAMQAVGVAAGIFAGILGLVANKLEETGHSDAAKVISGIAAGLGTLAVAAQLAGAAFTIMSNLITTGAMSASAAITAIPIIGWIAGLTAAAVAIGTIIAKSTETTEEKLERLKQELQDQKAYLESVKNEYDEINDTLISLSEQEEALKGMTARTEEWDEAVKKLNNDYQAFGEKFPDYLEAIEFDEKSGRLILNPETVERINKKREEEKALAQVGVDVAEIAEAHQEYLVKKGELKNTKTEKVLEEEVIPKLENGELQKYSLGVIKNIISQYSKETIPESARKEAKTIIEDFKSIIPNDMYDLAFDKDDYMYDALDYILDIYRQVEAYKEYLSVTQQIVRRGANSYVAGIKATGLVKTVAQEKGEEAANEKLKNSELEINIDDYVDRWAKSKGYTLEGKGIYRDKEGTRYDITDSTVKESIWNFATGLLASQASQEAIDKYLRNISVGNYKLVSGQGTYEDYATALTEKHNEDLTNLYDTYYNKIFSAIEDLRSLTQGVWKFNNLSYLEVEDIKTLGKNWQSKFGKSAAKELLLGFQNKLSSVVSKEEIEPTIEALVTVLGNVESGVITNLQDFSDALAAYGIELEDLGIDTSFLFKKPVTFEQAQEDLKTNLEFWNTARTSTSFAKEDRNKLIQGGMKEGDFILTSQGYVPISAGKIGGAAKRYLYEETQNQIDSTQRQIEALDLFNKGLETYSKTRLGDSGKTVQDILNSKDLSKEDKDVVRTVLWYLAGNEVNEVYNPNTGKMIKLADIDSEDAATFLQWYLDNTGRVTELRGEKGALESELDEIDKSVFLDLAPEIQNAIIDIITQATQNGASLSGEEIEFFIQGRDAFNTDKQFSDFLSSFSQLDWSEIDDINDFSKALEKLGIDFDTTSDYARILFDALQEIYSLGVSDIQKNKVALSRIESVRETAEKIVNGEKTISESEFNAFKKVQGEEYNPEEWVKTGQEKYTYIGKADNLLKYVDSAIESYISSFSSPEDIQSAYFQGDAQYLLKEAISGQTEASQALEAQVVEKGLSFKVEDYGRKLELDIDEINEEKDALNALAIAADKTEKSIDGLNEALSKDFQTLKQAKEGTSAYNTAMSNILKAAKKVFGNDITSDWIKEHIKEFEDLAKGGDKAQEAFDSLAKTKADQVLQEIVQSGIFVGDALNEITEKWDYLNGSSLDIGATFDTADVLSGMELTEEQAELLSKYLNSIPRITAVWEPGPDGEVGPNGEVPVKTGTLKITKTGASGSNAPTSGGGGGGGKKFKNDFDKYYNQVEDINELERQRNLLEKDYNQLLKSESKSGVEIYNNLKQQLELLEKRRELTADLAEKRKQQLFDVMTDKEYKDVQKYAKWNEEDQTIEIDWEAINKIKKSKEGDLVKEYVKKLEEYQKMYDEQIEALEDIEDAVQDIRERGREQYTTLEDRTRDALIKQIQDKIDELTDVNESINDTNQKLFDAINETLELQRQDRENKKTEEELTDKEKRLAYLQQDSSNANQVEIAKLQEELEDERQDYTDNLIDQKISELQRQNDKAQEQRQEQIDLMQHSLDWQEKSGAFWNQAYALLDEGIGPNGTLVKGSQLETLLKKGEAWDSLSQEGQMKWLLELEDLVSQGIAYLGLSRQLEDIGVKKGTEISFTAAGKKLTGEYNESAGIYDFGDGIVGKKDNNGNIVVTNSEGEVVGYAKIGKDGKATFQTAGQVLTGIVDKDGNVIVTGPDGKTTVTYKGVFQDYDGTYRTLEQFKDFIPEETKATGGNNNSRRSSSKDNDDGLKDEDEYLFGKVIEPEEKSTRIAYEPGQQYLAGQAALTQQTDTGNNFTIRYIQMGADYHGIYRAYDDGRTHYIKREKHTWDTSRHCTKCGYFATRSYATGGLADFTGPAWLDGTKSHPELVLNSRDTENFIELKDTLTSLKSNGSFNLTGGDNYYDIKIQVDSMSSDYDVDRAIDRIKSRLAQENAYRNVNALSRLR